MRLALLALLLFAGAALGADPGRARKAGDGCGVRFFAATGFEQPMGRLAGALYINSLAAPGLIGNLSVKDYFARARSVMIGPEALLVAYSQPGFRDELVRLEAGRRVGDLAAIGFPKRAASLKVICIRP